MPNVPEPILFAVGQRAGAESTCEPTTSSSNFPLYYPDPASTRDLYPEICSTLIRVIASTDNREKAGCEAVDCKPTEISKYPNLQYPLIPENTPAPIGSRLP